MNVCSKDNLICALDSAASFCSTGSCSAVAALPPRSSSQFADHEIFMSSPVISDLGRATGMSSPSGALMRFS